MSTPISRRTFLQTAGLSVPAVLPALPAEAAGWKQRLASLAAPGDSSSGWVQGKFTGARVLVETLRSENVECVFGIPGAQQNELWDELKQQGMDYVLVTNEFSASMMADGYARATGRPGVLCVVPGPGLTNAMTGLGEALLDSVPVVCLVGDVARDEHYRPFQVHDLPQVEIVRPVVKGVFQVECAEQIPGVLREAFALARGGEPGPVAVVVPYNLLIQKNDYCVPPPFAVSSPFDPVAFEQVVALLSDRSLSVGLYVGQGCMDCGPLVMQAAEMLQAPVATSISGKGVVDECHPLVVGYGYGPQGTVTAEKAFVHVDVVLAVGVKFTEVSTGFYSLPTKAKLIHVDINRENLGRTYPATVAVHSEAGIFFASLLERWACLCHPRDDKLLRQIEAGKVDELADHRRLYAECGVDPMAFLLALRRALCPDAMVFVDVTQCEHWANTAFTVRRPRTFFNPVNNQAMGWSIPASLGAQRAFPGRQTVTITGDGCLLMTAMELATAAREGLGVKFFVLDDGAYHYMQTLQKAAYKRTTATVLPSLHYPALAQAVGLGYAEVTSNEQLEPMLRGILHQPGPMLVRVPVDYGKRPVRWINAVKNRYLDELSPGQQARLLGRVTKRSLARHREND